jgi:predicted small integral membrane protein
MPSKNALTHRYLKIALTLTVALLALFYVAHNLANWAAANGAVGYVLSLADHTAYPNSLVPPVHDPAMVMVAVAVICLGEISAGVVSLIGAFQLWRARKADVAAFSAAKRLACLGAGLAALVWFFLFEVIGGALFQMWQTTVGSGSHRDAMSFAILALLTLIYLAQPEPE